MAYKKSFEFDESAHLNPPNKGVDRLVLSGIAAALAGVAFVGIQDAHFKEIPEPQGEVLMAVEPGDTHKEVLNKAFREIRGTTNFNPSPGCIDNGLNALNSYEDTWVMANGTFEPVIAPEVTEIIRPETC